MTFLISSAVFAFFGIRGLMRQGQSFRGATLTYVGSVLLLVTLMWV